MPPLGRSNDTIKKGYALAAYYLCPQAKGTAFFFALVLAMALFAQHTFLNQLFVLLQKFNKALALAADSGL